MSLASQLTVRLMGILLLRCYDRLIACIECESYMRIAREGFWQQNEAAP